MSKTFPWNGSPLAIFIGNDKALGIRETRPGDKPEHVFKLNELEDLFATLAASKRNVRCENFVMFGDVDPATQRAKPIIAAIPQTKGDRSFAYAYTPKQVDSFVPLSFVVRARGGFRGIIPILMAYSTPWERRAGESIQRVTQYAVTPAGEPALVRASAKR